MKTATLALALAIAPTAAYAYNDTPQGFEQAYSASVVMGAKLGESFRPCPNGATCTFMFFEVEKTAVVLHDYNGASAKSICMADEVKDAEQLLCSNADGAIWTQRLDNGVWHTSMHIRQAWPPGSPIAQDNACARPGYSCPPTK